MNQPAPRDRPFNPYRCPKSDKVRNIVADIANQLQNYEKHFELRKRKRRPADQVIFEATVSAIVCDLIHHDLTGHEGRVAITRSNRTLGRASRYRPAAFGKRLPHVLDCMASQEMAFIELDVGEPDHFGPGRQTTIKAGKRILTRIEEHRVSLDDLGTTPVDEIIILKRAKEGFGDKGGFVEYDDTPETHHHRSDLSAINNYLAEADIRFDHKAAICLPVATGDRRLRRYFTNGSFESGGRLFGGFWQALQKQQRSNGLLIDGEKVISLDYSQMAARIAYGIVREQQPEGDAYDLGVHGMPRDGVKLVLNALLFVTEPLKRMPQGGRQHFRRSIRIGDVVEKIRERHPKISHLFCTGVGHKLQFIESEILVDVLLGLKDKGIVALPVHDAVIVRASAAAKAIGVMERVFEDHTGVMGMVEEEA